MRPATWAVFLITLHRPVLTSGYRSISWDRWMSETCIVFLFFVVFFFFFITSWNFKAFNFYLPPQLNTLSMELRIYCFSFSIYHNIQKSPLLQYDTTFCYKLVTLTLLNLCHPCNTVCYNPPNLVVKSLTVEMEWPLKFSPQKGCEQDGTTKLQQIGI